MSIENTFLGRWAICRQGRVGKVEKVRAPKAETAPLIEFIGTGLDGKPWQTVHPKWLSPLDSKILDAVSR
jgi:hypothetical protein